MDKSQYWKLIDCLDWSYEGDDEAVIEPVVSKLSQMSDEEIFAFDDIMSELLYAIDGKQWAIDTYGNLSKCSDDDFLYTRCVAIVNGEGYYNSIKYRIRKLDPDLEFESILYIPQLAWEKKHGSDREEYSYMAKFSYETGSNVDNW